jgi:ribosome-binding ATPase YchF (GTP1/OBG family)
LEEGKLANHLLNELSESDLKSVKSYCFLTLKPFVYAINIGQDDIKNGEQIKKELEQKIDAPIVLVCAKLESEMM